MGDEMLDFATGVVNVNTGVDTTTDTIFQIGSNTKLLTATLIMQLVEAGKIDLDKPVRRYLKGFDLDDKTASLEITTRQLMTHTSGIQGDCFDGFGRGDDAIERYVAHLRTLDLVHRPGQLWSYCNSGWVIAGRLVEVLTGLPYHQALRERIVEPLGLTHMTVLPSEMIAHRCAVGHVQSRRRHPTVPPVVLMEYAHAPAGSVTVATAAELVTFVQMHLSGGVTFDGRRILSGASAAAMQVAQFDRPSTLDGPQAQGLGWLLENWGGKSVIGHGGGTIGQLSFLQAIPEERLVVALLTNSVTGRRLWRDLGGWLFDELAGVQMSSPIKPAGDPPNLKLGRYAGTYERLGFKYDLSVEEGSLVMRTALSGPLASLEPTEPEPVRLEAVDERRFFGRDEGDDVVVVFQEFERGRPGYLFLGRAARRVSPGRAGRSK